ncbi:PhzF family phenazine biosynthesis protein [Gillisia limnaea]|uniref:Phenazine biosynthesis protein PhzF family n=1 Tax=Gillisia limnaea (strain DSM 15749 / LMG 21470 / R-8282) TaxID=865937 RepID=H2BTD3_GILLR|nr:PhzF family phenazine biosynthesis protein [Gillisia limnaea]EHQ03732.1 phenazine biosynthesis protein PhzF family [Gillisia limnaea DSM 15749]
MKLPLYQIDAFTDEIFAGNPACVVPLQEWIPDILLLKIAGENAVAETAFFVDEGDKIHLRWFTPETEMDLCGHATLATAHALHSILEYHKKNLVFTTKSGDLKVSIENDIYTLDFPSRKPLPTPLPEPMDKAINLKPAEVLKARDFVLVYSSEEDIRNIEINRLYFDQLDLGTGGVIFTASGTDCDFVSRFFTPGASVFEDPVTGSAHCSLIPYWSEKLNKTKMNAKQISNRGGSLICENKGERILISGKAKTYSKGFLWTD